MILKDGVLAPYDRHIFVSLKRVLFQILFALLARPTFAQGTDTLFFGPDEYKLYQYVFPELNNTGDSLNIAIQLHKLHSLNHYLASEARKKGYDTIADIKADLHKLTQVLTARYLADQYRKNAPKEIVAVSDAEVKSYYLKNKHAYTQPGYTSYIKVYLTNTAETEKKARELLTPYLKNLPNGPDQIKKYDGEGVLLTYDHQMPLQNGYPYYQQLLQAKKGELIGPITLPDQKVMLLVTDIKHPVEIPYEQVKDVCRNNLIQEKISQALKNQEQQSLELYPVILNPILFHK